MILYSRVYPVRYRRRRQRPSFSPRRYIVLFLNRAAGGPDDLDIPSTRGKADVVVPRHFFAPNRSAAGYRGNRDDRWYTLPGPKFKRAS